MKRPLLIAVLAASVFAAAGCGGDVSTMLTQSAEVRDKVMTVFSSNGAMAGQMVDRLLSTDSTQVIVVDKVMGNGAAVQAVLARVAKDPTMVDGVLSFAVQDTNMKRHVLTLLKGMEMAGAVAK